MLTPAVRQGIASLTTEQRLSCVIVGIESHICVTQTALDLLQDGHAVYVIADGVSSCNKEEVPIALARLRQAGAVVTTSESWIYECAGDAAIDELSLPVPPTLMVMAGYQSQAKKATTLTHQQL